MARLNIQRQEELEPKRMLVAKQAIDKLGLSVIHEDEKKIIFTYKGSPVQYFPYSGWHTGKSIKDGRGLQNLLKQLI